MKIKKINEVVQVLKDGGVVAYPTETVYGLGVDIFDEEAVKKIYRLKGRDFKKPLLIAVSSFKMLKKVVRVTAADLKILKKLLPGPVAVVLPKKKIIPDFVTGKSKMVGVRFPDHQIALKIIEKFGGPITSTSANFSGEKEVTDWKDIKMRVDCLVRGKCKYKSPSTVIDLKKKIILREGVDAKRIKEILLGPSDNLLPRHLGGA